MVPKCDVVKKFMFCKRNMAQYPSYDPFVPKVG